MFRKNLKGKLATDDLELKRETESFAASCPTGSYHWVFRRKNIQLIKIEKNHYTVIVLQNEIASTH